jgi:hypothetical protein
MRGSGGRVAVAASATRERLGDAVESTELPGGHPATVEQPTRLAELIDGLRQRCG